MPDYPATWIWACGSGLDAIDAPSPREVWAVGTEIPTGLSAYWTVVFRSNGTRWISRSTPPLDRSGGRESRDVDAPTPDDAWTLEDYVDSANSPGRYRVIHWKAGKSRAFEYETPGANVSGLAAVSRRSVWIVGTRWNAAGSARVGPLVIHWNGRSATRQRTALDSLRYATLFSVDVVSPTEVWAAGARLLARYSR